METFAPLPFQVLELGGKDLYRHHLDHRLSDFAVRIATEEMIEVVKVLPSFRTDTAEPRGDALRLCCSCCAVALYEPR